MPLLHNTVLHSERLSHMPGYVEIIYSGVRRVGYIFDLKDKFHGVTAGGRRFEALSVWSLKEEMIPYLESIV